ncbi:MAG TPA: ABC transporter permease [Candidatus Didemnitutus sp.]|nr:ABC transporter permease [Candidatus Didemnitutus sp.]
MNPLNFALRQFRLHTAFSTLVIALLALGIGASTAIFGVVYAVLLKPLPYPEPGELVLARKPPPAGMNVPGNGDLMPDIELIAWLEAVPKSIRTLAGYRSGAATLDRTDGAVRAPTGGVTANFFPMLGVSAWRGRLLADADMKNGATPVTVLSYGAWQSYFNGDDKAIGQVVKLDDVTCTVVGVLPPAFDFVDPVQFWRPLPLSPSAPGQLRIQLVRVFGRLFPGSSRESAQKELDGISARFWNNLAGSFAPPGAPRGSGPRLPFADSPSQLVPLQEQLVQQSRSALWLLLGATGFVLLIACANIANLQLARASARKRIAAIRAALGASPRRLAFELLAENIFLALCGGALGVVIAWVATWALQAWLATLLPRINPIGVSLPVLGFAGAVAIVAGLGFGLMPAWQGSRVDLLETLKEGGHQASPSGFRWRQALVALEFALALVLAVNAGLLLKSIYQLYATDLGYRTADVLTANLSLPRRYSAPAQQRDFVDRWLAALRGLPGVKQASVTDFPPFSPYATMVIASGQAPGANASANAAPPTMSVASVTPDYFAATGIALRQGRAFDGRDADGATTVAIVNEAFVRQFHPTDNPLGATVNGPGPGGHGTPDANATIVGVVADIRPRGFESSAQPIAYFPLAQQPRSRLSAVLQFEGDASALARAVTMATHKVDADLALDNPQTLEQQLSRQTAPRRVTLMLTGAFAVSAVALAALGIFGVMSYTVNQRTREIGVRMALGADSAEILRWTMRFGALAVGTGLAAGLVLSLATRSLLRSLLTGVTTLDPIVMLAGVGLLAVIGLGSCLWPAWRAARVDPARALHGD